MTKILNFALKIKRVVGRVAHAKSSDPATPPKFGTCTRPPIIQSSLHLYGVMWRRTAAAAPRVEKT